MSFLNYSPSITVDNDLDGDISMRNICFLPMTDIEFIPFNSSDEINIKFITHCGVACPLILGKLLPNC